MLKLIEEYFIFMYQELMNEESFVEQSIGVVLNSFDELEKKINEFTESKRKNMKNHLIRRLQFLRKLLLMKLKVL